MIWAKSCLHYSFRQAAETYPKNYVRSEDWYSNFIAWVRVMEDVKSKEPGEKAIL